MLQLAVTTILVNMSVLNGYMDSGVMGYDVSDMNI